MIRAAALLLLSWELSAQSSIFPYADSYGPLYSIKSADVSEPSRARTIRDVDFRNMWAFEPGDIQLQNGRYEHEDAQEIFFESIDLASIYYLTPSYAVVLYQDTHGGGSTSSMGIAQLFRLSNRTLALLQRIQWNADARDEKYSELFTFDLKTRTMVIRSSHYMPGDAHCCISAVDVVTFRWNGARFEQSDVKSELTDYGERQRAHPR
jgi:hypothetical protein